MPARAFPQGGCHGLGHVAYVECHHELTIALSLAHAQCRANASLVFAPSRAQIAEKLFTSVSTVRTHLDRIRDKSGCRRRADLTRLALQEGII